MRKISLDKLRLNLGCGTDIKNDYIDLDIVALNGIDLVADLAKAPYPFKNDVFDEILMWHVLEHLPDIVITMEELHRISKPGCNVHIAVPYWNSYGAVVDPTHKSFFHHKTFDYFDLSKKLNQSKDYYTKTKFKITTISYICELKLLEILQILTLQRHLKIRALILFNLNKSDNDHNHLNFKLSKNNCRCRVNSY